MTAVSAFFDWLTKQSSPALGALITAAIGGFVAFVVAVVNAIAARLLERAKAHREFRAERIAPIQKLANSLVQIAHIALKAPAQVNGQGPSPTPPEMARIAGEAEAFFVPTGFPRERIDYFTKLSTEFALHVGQFRRSENPSPVEHTLLQAQLRIVELAARTSS
jgi:hypothetical protein